MVISKGFWHFSGVFAIEKGLFALISRDRLHGILQTLHAYTNLPIQLLDASGETLASYGDAAGYCALLNKQVFTNGECAELHRKAGARAQQLGESYIFTCHANLNHIAFALIHRGELLGGILLGPFLMDKPESTLVGGLLDAYAITPALALDLYDELAQIEVISTARVSQLSRLLGYLLSPLLPEERATLLLTREKLSQQSHINETIQMYKEQAPSKARNYFYEKEAVLLTKVKTGNMPQVKALLNDFLGYVFFHEGGKLEAVRMRALELTTLLSRVAMEGGARENVAYDLNASFSSLMNKEQSLDSICYLLQDAVEGFMQAMFSPSGGASAHIRRALGYVAANYPQPLTLDSTAREIGLSPSYLSALFKKATGMRFREHLNRVRVEEGKLLLLSTNDSLADIALALGFGDQSYFCKVFKRVVGLTPGQFRG